MITGTEAGSVIGCNLAEAFSDKYELYTPTRKQLDLTDYDAVSRYFDNNRIDIIILSAASVVNKLESDLKMFFNLEKYSRNLEKMIYFSSGAEYDKRFDLINVNENDIGKRIPVDEYGFAKYIMTEYARRSSNIYNLRFFGIFGKYEDWTYKYISNLCCKAIFNLPLSIRRQCLFDYIYVNDLPGVVEWMIENKPDYHDYNFVSGKPFLLTEIAEMVLKISGKDLEVIMLNPEGRGLGYTASNERLKKELPWFEPTPLYEAIEELYGWYYNNSDTIDLDILRQTR